MTQHPTIRLAGIEDRQTIEAIVEAAYAPYIPRMGQKPGPMLDDYTALIRQGRVHVLDIEAAIHGILVLIPEAGAMLLDNIAVAPASHGLGHGRKLLEFAEQFARDAGYPAIRLYTHETMIENIALYSRIGFVETHRADQDGFRRVFMTKSLA